MLGFLGLCSLKNLIKKVILEPIEAGGHLWDLTFELEDLLHRKVDLVSERSIKNPYFLKEIGATKYFIYGK
jgi:predicted nucleotidyltransferase